MQTQQAEYGHAPNVKKCKRPPNEKVPARPGMGSDLHDNRAGVCVYLCA